MLRRTEMSDYKREADLSRLLVEAVNRGNVTSVRETLDQGADVNSRDEQDRYVCVVY